MGAKPSCLIKVFIKTEVRILYSESRSWTIQYLHLPSQFEMYFLMPSKNCDRVEEQNVGNGNHSGFWLLNSDFEGSINEHVSCFSG